ncbi:cytosolic carboxypeptidase 1 [Nilaparvata lugens]|uniref:cytosolic carboxypeptidase 1 n=1 Tax=Nilaparvata lugens TaxID=108931 RepID=UPI00193E6E12|nr:cytosolic carboxypeptidase 1 [Nilaparvata lugens]
MSDDSLNDLLLDRIRLCALRPADNADLLRSSAARLHSRAASQDREIRERTLSRLRRKRSDALDVLMGLLESVRDHVTAASVAGTIRECIAHKTGSMRGPTMRRLVDMNATQVFVKLVISLNSREVGQSEVLMQELLWILGQISPKDSKFSIKARLLNGVKVFHNLLRARYFNHNRMLVPLLLIIKSLAKNVSVVSLVFLNYVSIHFADSKFSIKARLLNGVKVFHNLLRARYFNHNRMLVPLLLIIKSLAKNATTTHVLVKDGICTTLDKTMIANGYSPNTKLKLLLTVICYLSRSNRFCARMVKVGLGQQVLRVFERWERFDGKMRYRICYYTLQTLQNLCSTKIGRTYMSTGNGLSYLHKFCTNCPDNAQHDTLMSKACTIISLCLEKKDLPISSAISPARFPLADLCKVDSTKSVSDSDDSVSDQLEDEVDDDDEENLDQDMKDKDRSDNDTPCPSLPNNLLFQARRRDSDDLHMYDQKWSEMISSPTDKNRFGRQFSYCDSITSKLNSMNTKSANRLSRNCSLNLVDKKPDGRLLNNNLGNGSNLKILSGFSVKDTHRTAYCKIASRVNSVIRFVKVAYPDMIGGTQLDGPDPLFVRDRKSYRLKLLTSIERNLYPEHTNSNVIYDMDHLVTIQSDRKEDLTNFDEERLGVAELNVNSLKFESRFESGNLRKAIQVGPREYDLIMMPDVNSSHHHNWFYFEVSNMDNCSPYTLNIINCDKPNSQFNFGMRPLLFSVKEAVQNRPIWMRAGTDICYFKNAYSCPGKTKKKKTFQTISFTIQFPHSLDVCYIAYHFPYTYSKLMYNIWHWSNRLLPSNLYFRVENLCCTLNNNETPLLTITAKETDDNKLKDREVVFLTARVHPGESNTSWVMQGTLALLLGDSTPAVNLRSKFVFKIMPMLNPEGVINGCYRCGLSDEDLNRKWNNPDPKRHSVIYHTKGLIEYSCRLLKKVPFVYCDYHGHSRRKNVFLFGCSPAQSWLSSDKELPESPIDVTMLPALLSSVAPAFDLSQCSFVVEQGKEATARISVWRQFGVQRSYTMESSYCGFDVGLYKGNHMTIPILEEMGRTFCVALLYLSDGNWLGDNLDSEAKLLSTISLKESSEPRSCVDDFYIESSDSDFSDNEVDKK